jgi:hypothetical protein
MSSERSPISARLHPCFQLVHMIFKHFFVRTYDLLYGFSFSRTFSAFCRTTIAGRGVVRVLVNISAEFDNPPGDDVIASSRLSRRQARRTMNIKGKHFCYRTGRAGAPLRRTQGEPGEVCEKSSCMPSSNTAKRSNRDELATQPKMFQTRKPWHSCHSAEDVLKNTFIR